MNWIKNWIKKDKQKSALASVKQYASVFGTLDVLCDKGMLLWQERNRRLLIMQPLAVVMMQSADKWRNFLTNCFLWQSYHLMAEAHDHAITRLQGNAIRKAKENTPVLTKADTERIRRSVREDYLVSPSVPKIEPFEFYVITDAPRPLPRNSEDDAEERGEITLVGQYDPDSQQLEMETWEKIKNFLS